jgi:hypothetical protein
MTTSIGSKASSDTWIGTPLGAVVTRWMTPEFTAPVRSKSLGVSMTSNQWKTSPVIVSPIREGGFEQRSVSTRQKHPVAPEYGTLRSTPSFIGLPEEQETAGYRPHENAGQAFRAENFVAHSRLVYIFQLLHEDSRREPAKDVSIGKRM